MKPSLAFYIGTLLLSGALAGCGQPGALYLPKVPGEAAKPGNRQDSSPSPSPSPTVPPDYAPSPSPSAPPTPAPLH